MPNLLITDEKSIDEAILSTLFQLSSDKARCVFLDKCHASGKIDKGLYHLLRPNFNPDKSIYNKDQDYLNRHHRKMGFFEERGNYSKAIIIANEVDSKIKIHTYTLIKKIIGTQ